LSEAIARIAEFHDNDDGEHAASSSFLALRWL
jgi:hypothetical protein